MTYIEHINLKKKSFRNILTRFFHNLIQVTYQLNFNEPK